MIKVFKYYEGVGHGDFILVNTEEYNNDLKEFLKPDEPAANYLQ